MSNDKIIQTPFGIFGGVDSVEYFEDGQVKSLRLSEKNVILTHAGELTPYYSEESERSKHKASVTFYKEGTIKSVLLDEQQEVMTPIGEFPAELLIFYPTGELKRIFPLDGKISGFWSEEDERNLNIPFSFEFEFTTFTAMLVGIGFYESGQIRSITLFPKETIEIKTDYGAFSVKNGFSLYESEELESFEPATPQKIQTPVGAVTAYDVNAIGVNADSNSVCFDKSGRLTSVVTSNDKIYVASPDGNSRFFTPVEKKHPMSENETIIMPLKLDFDYELNTVTITCESSETLPIHGSTFKIFSGGNLPSCTPADCASCSLCVKTDK